MRAKLDVFLRQLVFWQAFFCFFFLFSNVVPPRRHMSLSYRSKKVVNNDTDYDYQKALICFNFPLVVQLTCLCFLLSFS